MQTVSAPGSPAITLNQVVKTFKNAAGEFRVLKGIDLTLREHEFAAIIGKSGSGKSTLLNMITGIDHPTSGEVVIGGTNIYKMNESQRALWRGQNIGIVFQFFQLLPMLTLLENTMLPMDYCKVFLPNERPKRAMDLLKMVGLEDQAHKLPAAVSTGQQQSAAIARALATDPPIIVADEPTGNLDTHSAETIIHLFDQLAQQGKTIAMVTHDASLTSRTSRTVIISDGELINETVAQALPLLTHRQMLQITHALEFKTYSPGEPVLRKDEHNDWFNMIVSGEVEIALNGPKCPDLIVARLEAGEFFGEIELMDGGRSIAEVRATPDNPVELAAIHRNTFLEMLASSPLTANAIHKIVQARLEEHRASERKCR